MAIVSLTNGMLFKVFQHALKLRIMVDDRVACSLEAVVNTNVNIQAVVDTRCSLLLTQ